MGDPAARARHEVTIRDVARAAGVSATTVSHALNGKGRLRAETQDRVRRAARELGYVANPQARGLKTGRSMTILADLPGAAGVSSLRSAFVADLLLATARTAMEAGYMLTVAARGTAAHPVLRCDGVLVVDPAGDDPPLPFEVPCVTVGRVEDGAPPGPSVDNDYGAGMTELLRHVRAAGYERPALLTTRTPFSYSVAATRAYRRWSRAAGFAAVTATVDGFPDAESGERATARLLARSPRPDALIATTELLALGALRAIHAAGLRVPDDIALASMDDSGRLREAPVPVTALDLRSDELGRRALELLLEMIATGDTARRDAIVVPTALVARASTHPRDSAKRPES